MPLASGTKLGPYEIQSPLGAGGMGEVYRALDTRLERTVAIKVLASHLSSSPELKQRMEREARAISSLNHPNICHLYDVGSHEGTDYLVMELLEGETLADRLRRGAIPLNEIFKIGVAVADALGVAHHQGIVHRDLKPGNIMLTQSGAKLMDFGLAKPLGARSPDLLGEVSGRALPRRARSQISIAVAGWRRCRGSSTEFAPGALTKNALVGVDDCRARCACQRVVLGSSRRRQQTRGRPFFDLRAGELMA